MTTEPYVFDQDTLNRMRAQRLARRRQNSAAWRAVFGGTPQDLSSTYMTPAQKRAEIERLAGEIEGIDQYDHTKRLEEEQNIREALRKERQNLYNQETRRYEISTRAQTAQARMGLDRHAITKEQAQKKIDEAKDLDPVAKQRLKAKASRLTDVTERAAEDEAMARMGQPDNLGRDPQEVKNEVLAEWTRNPSLLPEVVEQEFKNALREEVPRLDRNTPEGQRELIKFSNIVDVLSAPAGLSGAAAASAAGLPESYGTGVEIRESTISEQQQAIDRSAQEETARMRQTHGALRELPKPGAEYGDIDVQSGQAVRRLPQAPAPTGVGAATGAAVGGQRPAVGATAGAGAVGGAPVEGAEPPERLAAMRQHLEAMGRESDGRRILAQSIQFIEDYPESPPAQHMRQQLMNSEAFEAYKKARGYEDAPNDFAWKEFRWEARQKDKERMKEFRKKRRQNRRQFEIGSPSAALPKGSETLTNSVPEAPDVIE